MTTTCTVEDGRGLRALSDEDFPLEIGGAHADIALPSFVEGDAIAHLGISEGEIFVQPSEHAKAICNGAALEASRWLQPGDVLRFDADRLRVEGRPGALELRVDKHVVGSWLQPPPRTTGPDAGATAGGGRIRPAEFEPSPLRRERRRILPRGRFLLAAGLLAVVALTGGLLFASRSVDLEIQPTPDRLEVSGGLFPLFVLERHLLLPGKWMLRAEKEGFRPLNESFLVGRESSQTFRFDLEELPGRLVVTVPGVEAASVWVDGEARGEAPLELVLTSGEHELTVRAPRYRDAIEQVMIEGRDRQQTLRLELIPGWAEVSFSSIPSRAVVLVDGTPVGLTPLMAEVSAGARQIEIRRAGYLTHRQALQVMPSEPVDLALVELRIAPGIVALETLPPGAAVTVDGVFRGVTPLELSLEPGRSQQLVLSRVGFEPSTETIEVVAGERSSRQIQLAERVGELELEVWPRDAELLVNGESLGSAPAALTLPALPQEIEFRKVGYASAKRQVTPVPGLPQSLVITLETLEAAADREAPSVIQAGEGHELRRLERGRFRMGAPRREPGRRANEAFREVVLTRRTYVATREVTNAQFRRFRKGHLSGGFRSHNLEIDHHPVVRVSWEDAAAYCNWLSKKDELPEFYRRVGGLLAASDPPNIGYRLPTEAEWVWAARYADHREAWKYPWGDALPVPPRAGNYGDASARGLLASEIPSYDDGFPTTSPTDAFAPDELGFYDLDGNVAEWVHDLYAVTSTFGGPAEQDPMGADQGDFHVIRGSSWMHDSVTELRWSYREYGREPRPDLGFRIARYVE